MEKFYPDRKQKVVNKLQEMNKGKLYSSDWGTRFTGEGVYADNIKNVFKTFCNKYKLNQRNYDLITTSFRRNVNDSQLELF
jgi:hypothetical protein